MIREFKKKLENYISLFSAAHKPRINFQELYSLFPTFTFTFTFTTSREFGSYKNFGEAYEQKVYDMIATDENGKECFITYREYLDAEENLAYIS